MARSDLTEKIKLAIAEVEPGAEVVLYGSRARGDETSGSDWDVLIITASRLARERRELLRRRLYEIECATGEVISAIISCREEWDRPVHRLTPFYRNVEQEGVHL